MRAALAADRWAVGLFVRRAPAVAALLQVAGPRGWLAFAGLYSYFRVWDDRIDVPDRDPAREGARLAAEASLRGAPRAVEPTEPGALERLALARALERRALQPVVASMWTALERDAARPRTAMAASWLDEQQALIGGAYADALWICLGEPGPSAPSPLRALATTATRVHVLRDLHEDLALGYVNVPTEVCATSGLDPEAPTGPPLQHWRSSEARAAAQALEHSPSLGSRRTQLVFGAMARRYRGVAIGLAGT